MTRLCVAILSLALLGSSALCAVDPVIQESGVQGGLVVHLGCGDGQLTVSLRADDRYTVHGLEADAALVAKARTHVRSLGLYGPVSIEQFAGSKLPYTDNLINLIVVDKFDMASRDEVFRVLAPNGVAMVKDGPKWHRVTKPRPDTIDDWSHFLHDASGNAVAADSEVAAPRSVQWIAPPLWLRTHETPSGIQSPVSDGDRLYYFFDEGQIGIVDERLPDRWSLVCRDAFNGHLLWKKPLGAWGWREWTHDKYAGKDWTTLRAGRTDVPAENQRRIVATDGRVYATLDYDAPLSILDAATGELIALVEETAGVREILVTEGIVVCYTRDTPEGIATRRATEATVDTALVAVDGSSGEVLWREPCGAIRSLLVTIDQGRIIFQAGKDLTAVDLKSGKTLWETNLDWTTAKTIINVDGVVVMQGGNRVMAFDATNGEELWQKKVPSIGGGEGADLFVIDGLVWRGMLSIDDDGKVKGKTPNALVIGWDLRSGEEKREVRVDNLRSPEHHHRCYRNKATERFLISSFEGAEFLDFQGEEHGMNNFVRGACMNGMMPCNGMLYVPPDQCFCQPGSKLLGYAALKGAPAEPLVDVADKDRLQRGPAYDVASQTSSADPLPTDWPTFRHDPARSGSTLGAVPSKVKTQWKTSLGGKLTAPVAVGDTVYVAKPDEHTVYALDIASGGVKWHFAANGRIDSPPTIHGALVLFGSADGHVYCLNSSDGALVWRFLAAPVDRRMGYYDQIESAWPVHGTVLIEGGIAYFTAGRSTYLDGGIRVYGLDPTSGRILHKGLLEGPHRSIDGERDLAFFITGANSDVLVSEGGFLYMRQKKMTLELDEVDVEVLSNKGAQDVGLHIFSTSGMLDDSGYNRAFWMYSKRWPGFQLAVQAPKTGQLLVRDDKSTYAAQMFYQRNCHSPFFFPETEGVLLYADANTNEPQIVGEEGAVEPLRWLPYSDYSRGKGDIMRELDSLAFAQDKGIGYSRAEEPEWMSWLTVRIRAMVKADDTLFVAGEPDIMDLDDPYAAFDDRLGGRLAAVSAVDGKKLTEMNLESAPVFDGLIAASGRLFVSLRNGSIVCLGE